MDTRFWGPSGWRLLHLIANSTNANKSQEFWESLPLILPCKFCRTSLSTYYEALPVPKKQEDFPEWLYKIHNMVNQKLRDQGQGLSPDPPFKAVQEQYNNLLEQGCTRTEFPGWDFLFSIADNHPASFSSKPMPDADISDISLKSMSLTDRNKYNLLTLSEKKNALKQFWLSLPRVLPFLEWQKSWQRSAPSVQKAVKNRKSAIRWLWSIRCSMEMDLDQMSKTNFYGLCKKIANHRSGCSKSTRAKTCRAIRRSKNFTKRAAYR